MNDTLYSFRKYENKKEIVCSLIDIIISENGKLTNNLIECLLNSMFKYELGCAYGLLKDNEDFEELGRTIRNENDLKLLLSSSWNKECEVWISCDGYDFYTFQEIYEIFVNHSISLMEEEDYVKLIGDLKELI